MTRKTGEVVVVAGGVVVFGLAHKLGTKNASYAQASCLGAQEHALHFARRLIKSLICSATQIFVT